MFFVARFTVPYRVLSRIYHLGEKSLVAEGDKPLRGVPNPKFFEMNMRSDAIWGILRQF